MTYLYNSILLFFFKINNRRQPALRAGPYVRGKTSSLQNFPLFPFFPKVSSIPSIPKFPLQAPSGASENIHGSIQ
jgi:hypothetical protein